MRQLVSHFSFLIRKFSLLKIIVLQTVESLIWLAKSEQDVDYSSVKSESAREPVLGRGSFVPTRSSHFIDYLLHNRHLSNAVPAFLSDRET